jgi:alpha-L-fucosidase 2
MDHQIIRELYKNTIKASQILGLDNAFADTLSQQYKQIAPNQIGKHGQLQEWLQDLDDPKIITAMFHTFGAYTQAMILVGTSTRR